MEIEETIVDLSLFLPDYDILELLMPETKIQDQECGLNFDFLKSKGALGL